MVLHARCDQIARRDACLLVAGHRARCPSSSGASSVIPGPGPRFQALHWACRKGFSSIAMLLCSHGANIAVANKDGMTPEALAERNGHPAVVMALAKYRRDLIPRSRFLIRAAQVLLTWR